MRLYAKALVVAMVAVLLALSGAPARAALEEKPVLDDINDTLAVLRYLYRERLEAQDNLDLVHASRAATEKQRQAMQELYDKELAEGDKDRAAMFSVRLKTLERHMAKLNEFDFDKLFGDRVAAIDAEIKLISLDLDARMTEFAVLFGKRPSVNLDVRGDVEKAHRRRADASSFLDLD